MVNLVELRQAYHWYDITQFCDTNMLACMGSVAVSNVLACMGSVAVSIQSKAANSELKMEMLGLRRQALKILRLDEKAYHTHNTTHTRTHTHTHTHTRTHTRTHTHKLAQTRANTRA